MKLLIVESPAKSRKIATFLGDDYVVEASRGHVCQMPVKRLAVDIDHGFKPEYEISEDKRDIVAKIQHLALRADEIFLATDPDREGEAISQHLYDILDRNCQLKCKRITYQEITKKAILAALAKPREIDVNLVDAAKARQVLDRLIGYKVSPITWLAVGNGTSAGRVQSVALKLVCEKQREIDAFKAIVYWYVDVMLGCKGGIFKARVVVQNEKDNRFLDKDVASEAFESLKKTSYQMEDIQRASKSVQPFPPFDTNSLQGACSAILKWDITKSMKVAQELYEAGKCFLPGTLVPTSDGDIVKIEDFHDKKSIRLQSSCPNIGDIVNVNCKEISLQHSGSIFDFELAGGVLLSVTPEHIFPVFDSLIGEIVERNAYEIIPERDFILKPRYCDRVVLSQQINIIDLLKNVDDQSGIRIKFVKGFVKGISNIVNHIKIKYSKWTAYKYVGNDMLPFNIVMDLINCGLISIEVIESGYIGLSNHCSKVYPISFNLTSDFFYIAGLIVSDGHLPSNSTKIMLKALISKNPRKKNIADYVDVRSKINETMANFGINPSDNLNFSCSPFVKLLEGLGIPFGNKSKIVDFPSVVLKDDNYLLSFLAGLWDGDGYFTEVVQNDGRVTAIQAGYTSSSLMLTRKMKIVLSRFGIHTSLHTDNRSKTSTVKLSLYDVPILRNLFQGRSRIKTEVYDDITIKRMLPMKGRSPENMPIISTVLSEMERCGMNKNHLSKMAQVDIWKYVRVIPSHTRASWIPREIVKRFAEILESDKIQHLSKFEFIPITNKNERIYNGPVYCFESENGHFIIDDGILSHNCTYIRTDSFNIAEDAVQEVKKYISGQYGSSYLPKKTNVYVKKAAAGAQEAHECIRPTHLEDIGVDLSGDAQKMYGIIRDRFVACQMAPMTVDSVKYIINADSGYKLLSGGQTISFDGFSKVWRHKSTKDEILPNASKGEKLIYQDIKKTENHTKPPDRYTDASLANKLETDGVGRPATRAPIIKSLEDKGYLTKDKTALVPTEIGHSVVDFLAPAFQDSFMDMKYTSGMEMEMVKIADGEAGFEDVVTKFYEALQIDISKTKGAKKPDVPTGVKCSVCHVGEVVSKTGKFGVFFSCNNYPACKTVFEKSGDTYVPQRKKEVVTTKELCPKCGKVLLLRDSTYGKFLGCSGYPSCRFTQKFKG